MEQIKNLIAKAKEIEQETEKISPTVDHEKAVSIFVKTAVKLIPDFEYDQENEIVIENLIKYFNFDECEYDLKKGITLMGNVGSGKTELFKIFKACNFPNRSFGIKECRDMSEIFLNNHYKGINQYGKGAVTPKKISHMLFDDLGAENDINYYGNKVNVMSDIIIDRYRHFVISDLKSHFTTNLQKEEIQEEYGERVMSRLKQMTNFVMLGGNKSSKDRRK